MQLRTLRAFVEVVRQGGFSQAAKVVFATQSTVSKGRSGNWRTRSACRSWIGSAIAAC
jgi:Bacterial regulatory helix-turn-helix protein, lysR family